ncbi:MAG: TPM domain-containing protein [Steroidobacteraceae bacterium]
MDVLRWLRHLSAPRWRMRRRFDAAVRALIEREVKAAEARHGGEICFVVEGALPWPLLWRGCGPRERALQLFAALSVWDTEGNNGVLIHVLFADHSVEFVADRGISCRIAAADWEPLCREVEAHYRAGRFAEGSAAAIRGVAGLLVRYFPQQGPDRDELPNQPLLL